MERKGIISVGNWIVDSIKMIDTFPSKGNLVTIRKVEEGLGGCAHNVLVDLAAMKSGIPLYAGGCIGNDNHGQMAMDAIHKYGIDDANMRILNDEQTSYTDVMSEMGGSHTRTFFHYRGANAKLTADQVLASFSNAKIFHLGYLLLLDELDKEDPDYGVVAARVLKGLVERGYKTSVDVVSEEGDRFCKVVLPCLKYINYLIVNEVEAGACCRENLRDSEGNILMERVKAAAAQLMAEGVRELCVIHFPEGGYALNANGEGCFVASDPMPLSEIVSTVGAGDAFCAGMLYSIHENFDQKLALEFANACARFNLRSATSTGGAPTLKAIKDYLQTKNIML